jgi:outer membrane protein assembly factor BamB
VGQAVTGGATVFYSGTVASDTSATATGLVAGTTYYFKLWAKAGDVGSCDTPPCYVGGTQGTVTPRTNTTWSSFVAGGAVLNPAVAGTGRVSFGSNAGKLISVDSSTGRWTSVPGNTVSPVQGYVTVFSFNGSEAVVGGDQSGWVYSVDQATGEVYWIAKLNADAIQAPLSIYSRDLFGANAGMSAAYPGTYDIIFAATANNTASGGFINNKVFALRSDTGAVLWTFSPNTLGSPCPCPMDQIVGQPWVDIERARLYVTSGSGAAGTQNSIWIIDLLNNGGLVARFQGGDIVNGPVQSFDLGSLWVGNQAGVLNIVNLTGTPSLTTNTVASGLVYKGFIWEDFDTLGRLYFVTTDGFVRALATPTSSSFAWSTRPVAAGTVSQLLPGFTSLWVGGSNGRLYQLNLTTGAQEGAAFVVGAGSLSVGPVTTENGTEAGGDLFLATSDGTVYKVTLTGAGNLP